LGFDLQCTRFVLAAKRAGVDFSDALTLGRQNIHLPERVYRAEARRFGLPNDDAAITRAYSGFPYVDGILTELGAKAPLSMDASNYEGATYIADLNYAPPKEFDNRFTAIIDAGTIEHIFNFPQVVINVARMLKVGGHLISINGANNFTGHGFYQFSPELFFRVFAPENGFVVESMVLSECNDDAQWYEVADPAAVKQRVTLINNARTYLMMRARKTENVEMFRKTPQQSDYEDQNWVQPEKAGDMSYLRRPLKQRLAAQFLPRPGRTVMRRLSQATRRHFASPHLVRSNLPDD
jgi:SAM-dependent methyltransferase